MNRLHREKEELNYGNVKLWKLERNAFTVYQLN